MQDDSILSVGIDVGTTSTHMTVSRLFLANSSVFNQAPRAIISNRQIIYQSDIHLTPLAEGGIIDAQAVASILEKEFQKAEITPSMIKTGAAIITGESARLRNAKEVIKSLAHLAGELVVEGAGPRLEGVLAARGAGADRASKMNGTTILNVDIGGGTSNIAVYQHGVLKGSCCLNIGGRFLKFDANGTIEAITSHARKFLESLGTKQCFEVGYRPEKLELEETANALAQSLIGFLSFGRVDRVIECLVDDRADLEFLLDSGVARFRFDQLWLSGGVAQLMLPKSYETTEIGRTTKKRHGVEREAQRDNDDPFKYNDMGVLLASAIKNVLAKNQIAFYIPQQAIRATVIGASMHTLKLSGSTIGLHQENLPLRNLKTIAVTCDDISSGLKNFDLEWSNRVVALAISIDCRYESIKSTAQSIAGTFKRENGKEPLVILLKEDCGMALGQMLRLHLPDSSIVVVDGITLDDGDHIDIGQPLAATPGCTATLPVIVKTLVFPE